MRRIAAALAALMMFAVLTACASPARQKTVFAMDTVMTLSASGRGAKKALDEAEKELFALEAQLSRTREGSDVSRVNSADGAPVSVSDGTAALLEAAERCRALTGGAFDITVAPVMSAWGFTAKNFRVPSAGEIEELLALVDGSRVRTEGDTVTLDAGQSVDLGGIAKGYASDRIEAILRERGVSSAMIALGGNVYLHGVKQDGSLWRVGIQDPEDPAALVGVLTLRDAYAITSGGYQRYFEENGVRHHHIIDPAAG